MSRNRGVEPYKGDPMNSRHIASDAVSAKAAGISYGKYKAGLIQAEGESEYAVSSAEYLRPKQGNEPEKKHIATIK